MPYDNEDSAYQAVREFLEHPDGTMRFDDVKYWVVPLELAMKAHNGPDITMLKSRPVRLSFGRSTSSS